jgi:hypothetical protein
VGVLALVLILKWLIHGIALKKLNERTFIWLFPFWDVFYAVLAPIIYYTTESSTEAKWK